MCALICIYIYILVLQNDHQPTNIAYYIDVKEIAYAGVD
jgi:hypothetical protein